MEKLYKKPNDLETKIGSWSEPLLPERGLDILKSRYLRQNEAGEVIETPKELFYRVANVLASADSDYGDFDPKETEKKFYDLMANGYFMPNSPTLKGAGLDINLSACYVVPIEDTREGIFKEGLSSAVDIQAHGGGTGFNFSELRPKGSIIKSTHGVSSGPLSFMEVYDVAIGKTIAQGGTRQGANMGILNYNHGDIEEFIKAKNEDGKLRNFNISIGVTEEFMEMVKKGEDYSLIDHKGNEVKKVNAKDIFDKIVHNAWSSADPGIIFLDRIDRDNPTPNVGKIVSTNPCGEQPLLPYEACNLGSINLRKFVEDDKINYNELERVVFESVHFLDNVIEANNYPLGKTQKEKDELRKILKENLGEKSGKKIDQIVEEYARSPIDKTVKGNRKIGLGIMGFADMLVSLKIPYGSDESIQIGEKVMKFINDKAKEASCKLAKTRGVFPNWKGSIYDPKSENFKGDGAKVRHATRTTIAPTGTISNLVGVDGGIEPMFSVAYKRKSVLDAEGKAKYEFKVLNKELEDMAKKEGFYHEGLAEEILENGGSLRGIEKPQGVNEKRWKELQNLFVTSQELYYARHIDVQAAFQRGVDNAVSKTINLPEEATEEDVRNCYLLAHEKGLKGITIYRNNCKANQVLSTGKRKELLEEIVLPLPRKISPIMPSVKIKQKTLEGNIHMEIVVDPKENYKPVEVFAQLGNAGSVESATMEALGRGTSLHLRRNLPLREHIEQYKDIGSGEGVITRDGEVTSLPMGYARGLMKFELMNEHYGIENILSGKVDYDELDREVSDMIRTGKMQNENGRSDSSNLSLSAKKTPKEKCPKCSGVLNHLEGCIKCASCDYSKC